MRITYQIVVSETAFRQRSNIQTLPLRTFVYRFKLLSHIDAVITVLVLKT